MLILINLQLVRMGCE